ncbi:hypothetical protein HDE_08015 [Halotydeus destructor]|nr:hypothetical protein HDE_08015 [Halotydeus destructor]
MEEDEDDFQPGQSDKLSSLFTSSVQEPKEADPSHVLKYVAPKQPKKMYIPAEKSSKPLTVVEAAAVTAYQYVENSYKLLGKVGCAILGNDEKNHLVLYTGKQNYIFNVLVSSSTKFIVQPNNYVTVYDAQNVPWSLCFDSEDSLKKIAIQVTFCRYHSENKVIIQDLDDCSSGALKTIGDSHVELQYKAWATDHDLRSAILYDTSSSLAKPFRVKINTLSSEWSTALIGMTSGSRRVVICPLHLREQFGLITEKFTEAEDKNIFAFEFKIVKIRSKEPERRLSITSEQSEDQNKEPEVVSDVESFDDTRTRSSSKSDIIQRMAKLGKATGMVPSIPETLSRKSSVDDTTSEVVRTVQPTPKARTGLTKESDYSQNGSEKVLISDNRTGDNDYSSTPETLTQVSGSSNETKLQLDNLSTKMDLILLQLSAVQKTSAADPLRLTASSYDSALMLTAVQNCIDENAKMRKELDEKNKKLLEASEKLCKLLEERTESSSLNSGQTDKLRLEHSKQLEENSNLRSKLSSLTDTLSEREKAFELRTRRMLKAVYKRALTSLKSSEELTVQSVDSILRESIESVTVMASNVTDIPRGRQPSVDDNVSLEGQKYVFFDPKEKKWTPQPPEVPEIEVLEEPEEL